MREIKFILFFLTLLSGTCFGQTEIEGNWTGTLHQEPDVAGGKPYTFKFTMKIVKQNGKYKGTSTIISGPSFGIIEFRASLKADIFSFEEYKISDEKPVEGRVWCYKSGNLKIKKAGTQQKMSGEWQGYALSGTVKRPCKPGTIELTKETGFISLKGFVVNEKTTQQIPAQIKIIDKTTGKTLSDLKSTSGEFDIALTGNHNYEITVESKGFLTKFENVTLKSSKVLNIPLTPVETGQTIKLNSVMFEKGKIVITEGSYAELDRLKEFLKQNPTVKIELHGHTSNEGDAESNLILSEKRTKSIKEYLVEQGISESRIQTKAFGQQKPIASNDTEEGRKLNRRVEFVIIEK